MAIGDIFISENPTIKSFVALSQKQSFDQIFVPSSEI